MAKGKRKASGATEYQIAAPSEQIVTESVTALREVLSGKNRIVRAQKSLQGPELDSSFGTVCKHAAAYLLAVLARFPNATGERQTAIAKEAKRVFNASLSGAFTQKNRNSVKSTLAAIHRITLHPATVTLFGEGWANGNYGMEIPGENDKPARLTFWEGRKRVQAASRPSTPQDAVKSWATRMAKASKNPANFYKMAIAVLEVLASTPQTVTVDVPVAAQA